MMEKVTQMIAMLIKAWKKESVSQIDTPPVPATPEPKQQSPNNSACLTERVKTVLQTQSESIILSGFIWTNFLPGTASTG